VTSTIPQALIPKYSDTQIAYLTFWSIHVSPLSLSDSELNSIRAIAASIPYHAREAWLDRIAVELRHSAPPYGDGRVHAAGVAAAKAIAPKVRASAPVISGRD
jgi:hypothetical protein